MEYFISNLYFPIGCKKLQIRNYEFEELTKTISKETGHKIRAIARSAKKENFAKVNIINKDSTELDDICLILSLFTSYDVFKTKKKSINYTFTDPRRFTYSIMSDSLFLSFNADKFNSNVDFFQSEIEKIVKLIRSKKWLSMYNNGFHLLMLKEAIKNQSRGSSFINCWIIWEHLFYLLNKDFFSDKTIKDISSRDKLNFLLTKFIFPEGLNEKENNKLQELADIRNFIVHKGYKPIYGHMQKEFWLFIHVTQFIVAKTLKLVPNDYFDTLESFKAFLKEKINRKKIKKYFDYD